MIIVCMMPNENLPMFVDKLFRSDIVMEFYDTFEPHITDIAEAEYVLSAWAKIMCNGFIPCHLDDREILITQNMRSLSLNINISLMVSSGIIKFTLILNPLTNPQLYSNERKIGDSFFNDGLQYAIIKFEEQVKDLFDFAQVIELILELTEPARIIGIEKDVFRLNLPGFYSDIKFENVYHSLMVFKGDKNLLESIKGDKLQFIDKIRGYTLIADEYAVDNFCKDSDLINHNITLKNHINYTANILNLRVI